MKVPYPRSLAGQMALLVAIALFVAQAINFTLLLRERRDLRSTEVTAPSAARIVDAAERIQSGRYNPDPRTRVQLHPNNPIPTDLPRQPDIEEAIRTAMKDADLPISSIVTGVRDIPRDDPFLAKLPPRRAERLRMMGAELLIAVEQPGHGWLILRAPWPRSGPLLWQVLAQTLILYIVVLVPLLWAGHRLARPLRTLEQSTRQFRPGAATPLLEERGPGDVRALISAFNAMRLRVNAMVVEKDRMLGAIGHDLRTPLAALRVRIESVEDEEDRARMADIIDEMNRTLEDILSLARLGRPSEAPVETDMSALVDAVVEDFRDLDHDVTFEEAPRLPMRVRPALMRRAVRNLIENAVKYAGSAEVRLIAAPSEVQIQVLDRGPGIPPEKLERVFESFTRLEESRNRETGGIGLGLALARAIVGEAGGEVVLENRTGGGLCATITLPRG